ncbi:hypothetical protein ACQEVY_00460 [Streptomyces sp. CA-288835]|uniref:hypothetical protein n=1 Tax=Streptomyces sp. CA-288835 TaxID=3240069 RepID=UPI003D901CF0
MIRSKLAAVATAGAMVLGGVIAGAGTASASPRDTADAAGPTSAGDCLYVLNTSGYRTTAARADACNIGASDVLGAVQICQIRLWNTEVGEYVARVACNAASD